jgi:hypothetical protein
MGNRQRSETAEEIQNRWISGHLYYHQSLDPVVQGFVHPLVVSLVKDGQIDAFFFVRYGLGGPHIRLRLRVIPGARELALEAMQQSAERFFELAPSTRSMAEEAIRRTNESILAGDPNEIDSSVYPDNSFRVVPFRPEIQRYGGPGLFRASLDVFTLSSVAAVEFLSKYGETLHSAQLAQAFRLLLEQALGFAVDENELFDLLRYGVDSWGGGLPKVVEKSDRIARSQMDALLDLFRKSLVEVRSLRAENENCATASDFLVVGASGLSAVIGTTDRVTRARIGSSQLHMTATRLGLSNAEEVYISRLLTVTFREVCATNGADLSWLEEKTPEGLTKDPAKALDNLISPALVVLADTSEPLQTPT